MLQDPVNGLLKAPPSKWSGKALCSGVQATPSPYRPGAGGQTLRTWHHHRSVACPVLVARDAGQLRSQDPQATRVQTPSIGTQESLLSVLP